MCVCKHTKFTECFSNTVLSLGFICRPQIELQVPVDHISITASTFVIWFVVTWCCCFSIGFHTNEGTVCLRRSNLDQGFIQHWKVLSPNPIIEYFKIGHARISQHHPPFERRWKVGIPSVSILRQMILIWNLLFWDAMRRRWVVIKRSFGTTQRTHLQVSRTQRKVSWTAWPLKMGPISCPETSENNYQSRPRTIPEERISRLQQGGSLKSRMVLICNLLFRFSEQILLVRTVVAGLSKALFLFHPHAA